MDKEYLSKKHSKFLLKYHIIFVCKYRRKLLLGNIASCVKNILIDIANKSDFKIEVIETDKDHIHLLVCAEPKVSPLQIVRRLKQESTVRLWKLHPNALRKSSIGNTHCGQMDILFQASGMSVKRLSESTLNAKGSKPPHPIHP